MPAGSRTTPEQARSAALARWAKTPTEGRSDAARSAALARYTPEQIAQAESRRTEAARRRAAPCAHCGGAVGAGRSKICGSVECKRLYRNARMVKFYADYRAKHGIGYNDAKYPGRKAAENRAAGWTESRRAAYHRRRARKKGATVESFTNLEIFERDGWVCGICTDSVDPNLTYPHPMSPSLDHIDPLSLGGSHSRENTRLAHLTCNVKRGNRVA